MPALFSPGAIHATQGALASIPPEAMTNALRRHTQGDWGLCDAEDSKTNDWSVKNEARILSVYEHEGIRFWILTECDRSVTTFLLPDEY